MEKVLQKLAVGASTSPALSVNMTDIKKILVNASMVGLSAMVLYVSGTLSSLDFGSMTPMLIPLLSGALDFVYRYLKSNTPQG